MEKKTFYLIQQCNDVFTTENGLLKHFWLHDKQKKSILDLVKLNGEFVPIKKLLDIEDGNDFEQGYYIINSINTKFNDNFGWNRKVVNSKNDGVGADTLSFCFDSNFYDAVVINDEKEKWNTIIEELESLENRMNSSILKKYFPNVEKEYSEKKDEITHMLKKYQ